MLTKCPCTDWAVHVFSRRPSAQYMVRFEYFVSHSGLLFTDDTYLFPAAGYGRPVLSYPVCFESSVRNALLKDPRRHLKPCRPHL